MKKWLRVTVNFFFVVIVLSLTMSIAPGQLQPVPARAKYVFLFLTDGAGMAHLEIARQYRRHIHDEGFVIVDKIIREGHVGIMTTHAADMLATDSAAAATALARGCKANTGSLGVCADGKPAVSAIELARQRGMRIALVSNGTVYDASPAAFLCRIDNRRNHAAIVERYIEFEPDVLLGGGRDLFLPKSRPGSRRVDDSDPIAAFVEKGYRHVADKRELEAMASGKLLGLFSLRDMSFELDRNKEAEPSIYDMTRATIRLLDDARHDGFFAFIESESIDTASHLSDVASVVHEYREFDRAVELAYEFYRKYPRETLIIVTSDHETGGLGSTLALARLSSVKVGNRAAGTEADFKKLQSIGISLQKASQILGPEPTTEAVDKLISDHFPEFTLAPDFKESIVKRQPLSRTLFIDTTAHALGMMIANHTQLYWQTSMHTNQPVLVAALGVGAERFKGYYDNADFGVRLKSLFEERNHR